MIELDVPKNFTFVPGDFFIYLQVCPTSVNPSVVKITEARIGDSVKLDNGVDMHGGASARLYPIKLTEEILRVNGFTKIAACDDDETDQWHTAKGAPYDGPDGYEGFYIEFDLTNNTFFADPCNEYRPIYWVHELQQLLRLSGYIELANTFKIGPHPLKHFNDKEAIKGPCRMCRHFKEEPDEESNCLTWYYCDLSCRAYDLLDRTDCDHFDMKKIQYRDKSKQNKEEV